jgi:hypothetical protein
MFWKYDDWTSFAALNDDTDSVTTDTDIRYQSGASLEFDKVDGAGNTIFAAATRTWTAEPDALKGLKNFKPTDKIGLVLIVPTITNLAYAFLRIGTSASHCLEWRFADSGISASGWNVEHALMGDNYITGNGWDLNKGLLYVAVGCAFDGAANTLADMRVDQIFATSVVPTLA